MSRGDGRRRRIRESCTRREGRERPQRPRSISRRVRDLRYRRQEHPHLADRRHSPLGQPGLDLADNRLKVGLPLAGDDGRDGRSCKRRTREWPRDLPPLLRNWSMMSTRTTTRSRRPRQSFGFVAKTVSSIMNPRSSISSADLTACAMSSPRSFVGFSLCCESPAVA
jgi:hypothetical protein